MVSPKIGLVTVTFNSASVIDGFMRSVLPQDHSSFVLFIVDSGSKDDTLSRVAAYTDDRIRTIPNAENVGVAAGNNQGIEAALAEGCDYVLLINNDTEFGKDLLGNLVAGFEATGTDMAVPKMMYFDEQNRIWCAGGFFSPWRAWATRHIGMGQTDTGQFEVTQQITYAPTCCMLVRRSVFDRIGMMDERYFVYYDDTDFCFRALNAGITMQYIPTAKLLHKVSSLTAGEDSPFTNHHIARNRAFFIRKNLSGPWQAYCIAFCRVRFWFRWIARMDNEATYNQRRASFTEGLAMANRALGK
ncbi:MAG TPA: glycosyltransferase family 2 protein [Capsulimonadaceae bacterium]|jgi:hypothetical protein